MKTKRKKMVRKQLTTGILVLGLGFALPVAGGEHCSKTTSKSVPNVHYQMVPHVVLPESIQYNPVAKSQSQLTSRTLGNSPDYGVMSPYVAKYTAFPSYNMPFPTELKGVNQAVYPVSPKMLPLPLPETKSESGASATEPTLAAPTELLQTKSETKVDLSTEPILLVSDKEEIVTAFDDSDEPAEITQTGIFCSRPKPPAAWSFTSPLFKAASVPMVGNGGSIHQQGPRGCATNINFQQPMGGGMYGGYGGYGVGGCGPQMGNGLQYYTLPNGYSVLVGQSNQCGGLFRCRPASPQMMVFPPGMGAPAQPMPGAAPQLAPQAPADPVSMMMMMQMQAMQPQPITAMTPYGPMVVGYQPGMNPMMGGMPGMMPGMNPMMGMGGSPIQNVGFGGPSPMMGMSGMNGGMPGMVAMPGVGMVAPNGMVVPPAYALQIQQLQMQLMQLQQQNQQLKQGKSTKVVETGSEKEPVAGDLKAPMPINPQLAQLQQIQQMQQQQMNAAYGQQFNPQTEGESGEAAEPNAAMNQLLAANPYLAMGMNNLAAGSNPMAGMNPMMNPMMMGNPMMNPMMMNPMMMGYMNPMMNPMMVGMNPMMNPYMNPMMMGNPMMNPMFVGGANGPAMQSPYGPAMNCQNGGLTMSDVIQLMAIMKENQPRRQGLFRRIFSRMRERREARQGGECNSMFQMAQDACCTPYYPADTTMNMPSRNAYPYGYFGAQVGPQNTANYGGYYNLYMGNTGYPGLY